MAPAQVKEYPVLARVFLVGCSRSGTTVVQRCLNAHPAITSFPETNFFGRLVGGWSGNLQARVGRVRPNRWYSAFDHLAEVLERPGLAARERNAGDFGQAVDGFIQALDTIAGEREARVWVEKTPKHFRYVHLLERSVPDVRFIHLVRDGRDVVASLVDRARRYPAFERRLDPRAAARLWNEAVHAALRSQGRSGHALLAYEEFVRTPERELNRICSFLDIEYDPAMPSPQDTADIVTENEGWKSDVDRPIARSRSKFEEALTARDQRIVMRALDWRAYHQLFPNGIPDEWSR